MGRARPHLSDWGNVSEYVIEVLFAGLEQVDSLAEDLEEFGVITTEPADEDTLRVTGSVAGVNAVQAAVTFISDVMSVAPDARPIMAVRDLVNTTDIADRCGVSREAVRNWVLGRRRQGRFPRAVGEPGGKKVWEWGSVCAWLEHNLGLGDGLLYPTHSDFAEIDAHIKNVRAGSYAWHRITAMSPRWGASFVSSDGAPSASRLPRDWQEVRAS